MGDATFAIELRDRGPEFDPLEHDVAKLLEDTSMPTAVGGFGIHIARLVMDRVSHARRDGWNILRMEKRIAVRAERKAGGA